MSVEKLLEKVEEAHVEYEAKRGRTSQQVIEDTLGRIARITCVQLTVDDVSTEDKYVVINDIYFFTRERSRYPIIQYTSKCAKCGDICEYHQWFDNIQTMWTALNAERDWTCASCKDVVASKIRAMSEQLADALFTEILNLVNQKSKEVADD
jgi:hypothetical protein